MARCPFLLQFHLRKKREDQITIRSRYTFRFAVVHINTDIRLNGLHSAALKALQIPITPEQCKCLSHDSFVDSSTLVPRVKGERGFLEQIIETVKSSITISLSEKKLCGLISEA